MKQTLLILAFLLIVCVHGRCQKRFISVDSTKIWINTIGTETRMEGQPIVIFESGHGTPMDNWDKVIHGTSELAPVITYDRPGIGKSEPVDELPTLERVANRMVKILKHLELDPPYLLVGHSLGGVYVRGFAIYYPEMLAGLVIIDPADFLENNQNIHDYYEVLNWDRHRIDSLIQSFIDLRKIRNEQSPLPIKREGKILEDLRENEFKEITESTIPNIPVHIITGGRFDMPQKYHSKIYDSEALFRSKLKHRVSRWTDFIQSVEKGMLFYRADAGHFVQWDDPQSVISSIKIALKDYAEINRE